MKKGPEAISSGTIEFTDAGGGNVLLSGADLGLLPESPKPEEEIEVYQQKVTEKPAANGTQVIIEGC